MKTILALPLLWALVVTCLIGCEHKPQPKDDQTYHITCYIDGTKAWEGEGSNVDSYITRVEFDDEDGQHIIVDGNCVFEANRPRG